MIEGEFLGWIDYRLALTFSLTLNNGQVIETVGHAAAYFGTLSADQLGQHHIGKWQ
jgi:hypothetical protein